MAELACQLFLCVHCYCMWFQCGILSDENVQPLVPWLHEPLRLLVLELLAVRFPWSRGESTCTAVGVLKNHEHATEEGFREALCFLASEAQEHWCRWQE